MQSPMALLGLLALFVPIFIHLLSKARPQVIPFAHIAFINVKTSPLLRQPRLTQLILLGLRMLLLLLAALILAEVYWHKNANSSTAHILITQDWLNHTTEGEKQTLLGQAKEANLVLIDGNNRKISPIQLRQWVADKQQTMPINLWSQVSSYTANWPNAETIQVYSTNRLSQFTGDKTLISDQVEWHIKPLPVASTSQQYSVDVKVIYDEYSEPLTAYLRGAFDAINTHENLSLTSEFILHKRSKNESKHLQPNQKIIDLRDQNSVTDKPWQQQTITLAALNNIQEADFALTLAQLLFHAPRQAWWLENSRLSMEQITQVIPTLNTEKLTTVNKTTQATSLHIWLVVLLLTCFIAERLLSEWPSRAEKNRLAE
jgi:hypothetical protein